MYTFDSKIRYSEIGPDEKLTLESLIDYFQDCSTFQSEELGVGLGYMREHRCAWVVNYWQLEIGRLPRLTEAVRTGTSPYEFDGFMGLRNFWMDAAGERLVTASSVWSLVSTDNFLPTRVPERMLEAYRLSERLEMEYLPRKIRVPKDGGQAQEPITVARYHLDTNRHVNNGQYVRMAMGLLPEGAEAARLRMEYRRQAVLGDVITPVCYRQEENAPQGMDAHRQAVLTVSLNGADGRPYAVAEMKLR